MGGNGIRRVIAAMAAMSLYAAGAGTARAQTARQHIQTVFLILMENHNWTGAGPTSIKGNPEAPYINNVLIPMGSHAENYSNPPEIHPSLPNYLWLEAGTNFGIADDAPPAQNHQSTTAHLVTQLTAAGISWKAYEEDITGADCPLTNEGAVDPNGSQLYAPKHDPFVYFDDVTDNLNPQSPTCIAHVRPFPELATDLAAGTQPRYVFITPNLCDDMHDGCPVGAIAHGDAWLQTTVPMILNSAAYQAGGALFIVWDEALNGDGAIPMILLSPFAKGHGFSNQLLYTHGSMLRTIQEIFGVGPSLGDANNQQDLSDLFRVFP